MDLGSLKNPRWGEETILIECLYTVAPNDNFLSKRRFLDGSFPIVRMNLLPGGSLDSQHGEGLRDHGDADAALDLWGERRLPRG